MLNNPQFENFYNYLILENEKYNLTAITERNEVYEKHFFDSISSHLFIPKGASILDVGAGAGFPSIPLKIVRNDLSITMLDSVNKKVNFLNSAISLLELNNIKAIHSRIEDFKEKEAFNIVTSRATAPLNTLLEYLAPFAKLGGLVICYKGSNYEEEIVSSKNAEKILGLKLQDIHNYELPASKQKRVLLIYKKIAKCDSLKYPRGKNLPRVKPL